MQQARTGYQRMVSGARQLLVSVRRGGGVGVLVGMLLLPLHVGAAGSGDLDTSFGGDGTVRTDFGSDSDDRAYALAIQPDGKIVVAGSSFTANGYGFALARYLPNGTPDPTFSGDGRVTTSFGSGSSEGQAFALALQPDGKIVAAGWSSTASGTNSFALARYLPNGTLDPSFSGDGRVVTAFRSGSVDYAFALALQPDGKIVAGGISFLSGNGDFALARYLPNGTLDPSFSGDGRVLTAFGSGSSEDGATALALQPDGRIVVAGYSHASGYPDVDFALARYLPNGTLDASFGSHGTVRTDFGSGSYDEARALALQPDGKLVVAGLSDGFALARYLPNGTLDATFNGDGRVLTSFGSGSSDEAYALAIQPNGKIVVAGRSSDTSGTNAFALARYLPNGTLDATFSSDGRVRTDFGNGSEDYANALVIQPRDGRLVVAGSTSDASGGSAFALARYHAITCNGVVATRVGTAGHDTLMGTAGPDVIVGFDGDDTIYGLGGNDLLCGNAGDDTLYGGSGNDILDGDDGNDTLVGGTDDDTLRGDAGTDVCDGGAHVSGDTASGCEQVTGVP